MSPDSHTDPRDDDLLARGLSSVLRRVTAGESAAGVESIELASPADEPDEELPAEIAGYPVIELIGRGGVGLIYRSSDPELGRDLAIKVLARRHAADAELVRRFHAEARICSQLQHPGVVPVYRVGQVTDGRPYFTMKVVEGETLLELLRARTGPQDNRRRFLEIFEKVCQTLAYVHSGSVVHGDLKPGNIMVGAFGEVQVMDWGFARTLDPDEDAPGADRDSEHILGTPAYMAPEQARGEQGAITPRTDVFGLGAILCEILTGAPPYSGDSKSETYLHATRGWMEDGLARLDQCHADPALVDLVRRCLATSPKERPADAGAVDAALARYLESVEERTRALELEAAQAEERAAHERRTRRLSVAFAAVLMLAIVVATGALLWIQQERADHAAETRMVVAQAVERTVGLHERAQQQPPGEVRFWEAGLLAARQATELARARGAADEVNERIRDLTTQLEAGATEAARDRDISRWLEEVRPHLGDERGYAGSDDEYAAGFARFGFDVTQDLQEVAAALRRTRITDRVATGLDSWGYVRRLRRTDAAETGSQRLLELAQLVDPDPLRNRLRRAFATGDERALLDIAADPDLRSADPATTNLLARYLVHADQQSRALELLRQASLLHPGDFNLQHDLAALLITTLDPPLEEIIGLQRAAASLRPHSPHIWSDLGRSLTDARHNELAETALDRALTLAPEHAAAWRSKAFCAFRLHRYDDCLRAAQHVLAVLPDDVDALEISAAALLTKGDPSGAERFARAALAVQPKHGPAQRVLAQALIVLQRWVDAEQMLEAELRHQPDDASLLHHLGVVRSRRGDYGGAVHAHQRALDNAQRTGNLEGADRARTWIALTRERMRGNDLLDQQREPLRSRTETFSIADRGAAADAAFVNGEHQLAARLYASVADEDARLLGIPDRRIWAAVASAAVGSDPSSADGAAWRDRALDGLRVAMAQLPATEEHAIEVLMHVWGLRHEPLLAPYRAPAAAQLPAAERKRWQSFWEDLEETAGRLAK